MDIGVVFANQKIGKDVQNYIEAMVVFVIFFELPVWLFMIFLIKQSITRVKLFLIKEKSNFKILSSFPPKMLAANTSVVKLLTS